MCVCEWVCVSCADVAKDSCCYFWLTFISWQISSRNDGNNHQVLFRVKQKQQCDPEGPVETPANAGTGCQPVLWDSLTFSEWNQRDKLELNSETTQGIWISLKLVPDGRHDGDWRLPGDTGSCGQLLLLSASAATADGPMSHKKLFLNKHKITWGQMWTLMDTMTTVDIDNCRTRAEQWLVQVCPPALTSNSLSDVYLLHLSWGSSTLMWHDVPTCPS